MAALAEVVGGAFSEDGLTLIAAAYLHDIGYAPGLAHTGLHPLDGARFVRQHGHEQLALLVAHHSGARYEANLRGFDDYEEEFPFLDSPLDQALTYCDLTTSPDGERVTLAWRVQEITSRYGPDHTVARAINACVPEFERAQRDTEARMAEAGVVVSGSLALPR
ncbi:HDIG domain-containing protein [Kineococcus sp. NUM-3379]